MQTSIEKNHKERLYEECHDTANGITKEKTKSASIIKLLTGSGYKREPQPVILKTTKHETKTIIIARYGMLQCGKNYRGTIKEICDRCHCIDDENHRLNYCIKWRERNYYDETEKIDFDLVFSNDVEVLRPIMQGIEKLWNTRNAHGTMNNE